MRPRPFLLLLAGFALALMVVEEADAIEPVWNYDTGYDVYAVDISADGEYIVASTVNDGDRVYLFREDSSNPLWIYTTGGSVHSVAISADGEYIVAGSNDDKVYLFDKDSSTPLWSYTAGNVYSVDISADGEYIVAGFQDGEVYLFDKDSSTPLWSYDTQGDVLSVAISADGEYIAVGGRDYKVHLFDKDSSNPLWSYNVGGSVKSVSISEDGEYIAAGSQNGPDDTKGEVYLFDKDSNNSLWSYETGSLVWSVSVSADGEYIAAGSWDEKIYFFNKDDGTPLWNYTTGGPVYSVAISANGNYLAATGYSNNVSFFHTGNSTPLWSYATEEYQYSVAISANGNYLTTGSYDNKVYLFENRNGFANIESITPNPANYSEEIFFVGEIDENITAVDFYWNSSLDGVLSRQKDFSSTELSYGEHFVSFTAKSSDGDWAVTRFEMVNVVLGLSIILDSMYEGIEYPFAIDGYNEDEYEYTWDFGDGTTEEGKEVLHTYSDNGSFDIKVNVNLGDFEIEITENDVLVDNSAPIITIISYPQTLEEGEEYNVIVNITDLGDDIFSFQYGIIGSDSDDWDTVYCYRTCVYVSPTTWHHEAGIYVGLMTAEDEDGSARVEVKEINVTNIPPEITNVSFPEELYQYEMGHFSADVYDSEWDIIEASWGFEESRGDKLFFVETYHTFQNPGTHKAELCVSDEADTTCVAYTVDVLPAGLVEIVSITPPEKIEKGGEANFVANCYHCPDADIVWTSSIDGNISNNLNFSISDLSLGHHTLTLYAAHKEERWSSQQTYGNFWVYTKPIAIAGQDSTGTPGVPLQFSGAGTDEDGTVVLYEWDFDGDGVFEWSSTDNGLNTYIYNNEGTYTATLRVTDNDGFTDTDTVEVTISEKKIQIDDEGNVTVTPAGEDEEGIPAPSLAAAVAAVAVIALRHRLKKP